MRNIDELKRELCLTTGEALYRTIRELVAHGEAAQGAQGSLCDLIRYHNDEEAVGHAMLAYGLIVPGGLDLACYLEDVRVQERAAQKAARLLDLEGAHVIVGLLLGLPFRVSVEETVRIRDTWMAEAGRSPFLSTPDPRGHQVPESTWVVWLKEIARRFPCVIPDLVEAFTRHDSVRDGVGMILQQIGMDNPEVARLLEPLFEHESEAVRNAALSCAAWTRKMPLSALPLLIQAAQRERKQGFEQTFCYALSEVADVHPREVVSALIDMLGAKGLYLLSIQSSLHQPAKEVVSEELIPLLDSPDPEFRRAATVLFCHVGTPAIRAMPRFCELLNDEVEDVRNAAHRTLSQIGRLLAKTRDIPLHDSPSGS